MRRRPCARSTTRAADCSTWPTSDGYLERLRGYPVVINVWAEWCAPCREEFPLLRTAAARHGTRVAFLGVNVDRTCDHGLAERFLREQPTVYPSLVDPDERIARRLEATSGRPSTVFLDPAGEIVTVRQGAYAKPRPAGAGPSAVRWVGRDEGLRRPPGATQPDRAPMSDVMTPPTRQARSRCCGSSAPSSCALPLRCASGSSARSRGCRARWSWTPGTTSPATPSPSLRTARSSARCGCSSETTSSRSAGSRSIASGAVTGSRRDCSSAPSEYAQRQRADALRLAAQTHAQRLYVKAGFRPVGEPFDEAGIQHVWMVREVVPLRPAAAPPPAREPVRARRRDGGGGGGRRRLGAAMARAGRAAARARR